LDDAKLKTALDKQSEEIKKNSQETIINRWNSGRLLTADQLAHIRAKIPSDQIKSIVVWEIMKDKTTGKFAGEKQVTKYFNKYVVRTEAALELLPDECSLPFRKALEENAEDLETKMIDIHHMRANEQDSRQKPTNEKQLKSVRKWKN